MQRLTDEERKKLVKVLRSGAPNRTEREAAGEIERLADEVKSLRGENDWLRVALRAAQMGVANAAAN